MKELKKIILEELLKVISEAPHPWVPVPAKIVDPKGKNRHGRLIKPEDQDKAWEEQQRLLNAAGYYDQPHQVPQKGKPLIQSKPEKEKIKTQIQPQDDSLMRRAKNYAAQSAQNVAGYVSQKSTEAGNYLSDASKQLTQNVYLVKKGDTLYSIAQKNYGNTGKWKDIYEKNKQIIGNNPNSIEIGQRLVLPP